MAGKNMDYWYDEQIKRYLLQLIRIFSHFQIREVTRDGENYVRVPCRYADSSRMVAHILRNNSENFVANAPQIAVGIQSLAISRERTQEPFLSDTQQVAEREWDRENNIYTSNQGNLYTVQRYMPVPYTLTIQVDIFTTNTDSKLQILEQIFVLFNPSIQLQSNDNPLDWSNVFEVELTDISWSNRSIPAGVDETLDISTLTFQVPIWISPPAKVQRQKIIQKIIADVHSVSNLDALNFNSEYYDFFADLEPDARAVVTPNDLYVSVQGAGATLLTSSGTPVPWTDIIEMQGKLTAASRLEFNLSNDVKNRTDMVTGTIVANPVNSASVIFNLDTDTLPANTLANIDRIIDPVASTPGSGLPAAAVGQRYLITDTITADNADWLLDAAADSIIEYSGTTWNVVFDSTDAEQEQIVTNSFTGDQFRWTGTEWISSWQGVYNPGFWRLIL